MTRSQRPYRGGDARRNVDQHRSRLIAAMTVLAAERGWHDVSVADVCARASVSRAKFYELFTDREACFVAAVESAGTALNHAVAQAVCRSGPRWEERVGAALLALLSALDADRHRAWVAVVEAAGGGPAARERRERAIAPLVALVDEDVGDAPAAGVGAVGAVLEMVYRQLTGERPDERFTCLVAPAAYIVLAPRLGRAGALRAAQQLADVAAAQARVDEPAPADDVAPLPLKVTELTESTLAFLARCPGACNAEVAAAVGIEHESQVSRHLARLEHAGAARRTRDGRANAWELTEVGSRLVDQLLAAPRVGRA